MSGRLIIERVLILNWIVCSKIDSAEDMAQCGAAVQVAMKYRDPQNAWKFLFTFMIVGRYFNNNDCEINQPAAYKC
jgi:hypothetical protein